MNTAFRYAQRQLLGMAFEPFVYTSPAGVQYRWANPVARLICRALIGLGMMGAAEWVFRLTVRVD